jgi:hypothetical protein
VLLEPGLKAIRVSHFSDERNAGARSALKVWVLSLKSLPLPDSDVVIGELALFTQGVEVDVVDLVTDVVAEGAVESGHSLLTVEQQQLCEIVERELTVLCER